MQKLFFLLGLTLLLSGCSIASSSYQPGLPGVREVPHADCYVYQSGEVKPSWP
ncbi:MAG: lipoprotein [Pirellulales bacterium]|nr:lipoprotein [Pirellulales bacterium]